MTEPIPDLSEPAADLLRAAYYYGIVDGHAVVVPALLLVAAARNDETVKRLTAGSELAEARPLLAAAAADRATSPGPSAPGVPKLLETRWWVVRENDKLRSRHDGADGEPPLPEWDAEFADVLARAAEEAAAAGAERIGVAALLLGVLRSTHPCLLDLAGVAGFDPDAVASALRRERPWAPENPDSLYIGLLVSFGITDQPYPMLIRWIPPLFRRIAAKHDRWSPVMVGLELEVLRQAVITGHPAVQTAHLLLAMAGLQEQITAIGSDLAARHRHHNQGDRFLDRRGFVLRDAQRVVAGLPHATDVLTADEIDRRLVSTGKTGDPTWASRAVAALDDAAELARSRNTDVGTTYVLAAALRDPEASASVLLRTLGLDASGLRDELDVP